MNVFEPIMNQMIYLFALILIGYLLTKLKAIPEGTAKALSRLESMLFIPALVLSTFIKNFTADKFEAYKDGGENGEVICLSKNFRSRSEVIETVNFVFSGLMSPIYTSNLTRGRHKHGHEHECPNQQPLHTNGGMERT